MKATPYNQKTIAEFQAKQGRGVGMWGDHVLLMTAKGARSGEAIGARWSEIDLAAKVWTELLTSCPG